MPSATSLTAALMSLLFSSTQAFWRMPCRGRTGVARIDPIVYPGRASIHPHAIHGAGNFDSLSTYSDLRAADCTSCSVLEDHSAYWAPPLYFQHDNGTMRLVPQVGGMLAYYLLFGENIQAFPPGFVMVAGDNNLRNFSLPIPDPPKSLWVGGDIHQSALRQKALGFNCLDYSKNPEGALYRHFMPDKEYLDRHCKDGIRLELMFPSCWNGQDIDSDDHKSHVAYSLLVMGGECPKGYEHRIPSLFYESIWDTYSFKGIPGRFVLGNGDPTGFGYHGDFMNGWDPSFLQQAIETCTNSSGRVEDCPLFTLQSDADSQKCRFNSEMIEEDCTSPQNGLCGNVHIFEGPEGYGHPDLHPEDLETSTPEQHDETGDSNTGEDDLDDEQSEPSEVQSSSVEQTDSSAITVTTTYKIGEASADDGADDTWVASKTAGGPIATIGGAHDSENIRPLPFTSTLGVGSGTKIEVVSTSTSTSFGTVYEVVMFKVDVTVTETQMAEVATKTGEWRSKSHLERHRFHNRRGHA